MQQLEEELDSAVTVAAAAVRWRQMTNCGSQKAAAWVGAPLI